MRRAVCHPDAERGFVLSTDEFVKRIDDAYTGGDQRSIDAIFEEMGSPH
jgi:hypothetical protein